MKKYLLCILISWVGYIPCWSQQLPFFTHHVLNPYIYNPAFAGYDQSAAFYLTHRQQWLGIEDAPASTHLSFHTPAGNNNPISLGADIVHDRIGVLRHSSVKATIAYLIPLSAEREHYLKAGFSAGIGMHQYNVFDTPSDPTILRAGNNSTFLDGRFGLQYHFEKLNIGLALPHLLTPPSPNPESFSNVAFDQLSRVIASMNYRFEMGVESSIAFIPTLLYNFSQESTSQAEAIGLFEFHRAFWVGGTYQQQLGFGGLLGFKMKNFKFSYHYATSGSELAAYAGGTHEAQLGFTVGKKKVMVKRKPRLTTQTDADAIPEAAIKKQKRRKKKKEEAIPDRKKLPSQRERKETFNDDSFKEVDQGIILIPSEDEPGKEAPANKPASNDLSQKNTPAPRPEEQTPAATVPTTDGEPSTAPDNVWQGEGDVDPWQGIEDEQSAVPPPSFNESAEKAITKVKTVSSNHPLEMKGGTYIIAGTFSQRPNADRQAQKLAQQGYSTKVGYNTAKGYYYVSLYESDDIEEVKKRLYRARGNDLLKNTWILVIE